MTTSLLNLPREIRDAILYEALFPSDSSVTEEGRHLLQFAAPPDARFQHRATARDIQPQPAQLQRFRGNQSVFVLNQQVQHEASIVFFKYAVFDLTHTSKRQLNDRIVHFLSHRLSSKQRQVVRHVQLLTYYQSGVRVMPVCEWEVIFFLLGRDFPALRTLRLYGQRDVQFGGLCFEEAPWVPSMMTLKGRLNDFEIYFDQPAPYPIDPSLDPSLQQNLKPSLEPFFAWLKGQMTKSKKPDGELNESVPATSDAKIAAPTSSNTPGRPLTLLNLPAWIRRRIYTYAILPPTRLIHPLHPAQLSHPNILPLLLTCRSISTEVEHLLYSRAIFSSCNRSELALFKAFLFRRPERQMGYMRRFYCVNDVPGVMTASQEDVELRDFVRKWPRLEDLELTIMLYKHRHACTRTLDMGDIEPEDDDGDDEEEEERKRQEVKTIAQSIRSRRRDSAEARE